MLSAGPSLQPAALYFCPQSASSDAPLLDAASLPLEHRAAYGPPAAPVYGPPPLAGGGNALGSGLGSGLGGGLGHGDEAWPLATPDMPQIKHLQVQCEKTHMRVNIEFDRPFYGMIFSKGESRRPLVASSCALPRHPHCKTNLSGASAREDRLIFSDLTL